MLNLFNTLLQNRFNKTSYLDVKRKFRSSSKLNVINLSTAFNSHDLIFLKHRTNHSIPSAFLFVALMMCVYPIHSHAKTDSTVSLKLDPKSIESSSLHSSNINIVQQGYDTKPSVSKQSDELGILIDSLKSDASTHSETKQKDVNDKRVSITSLSDYIDRVNKASWSPNMVKNTAMTVKLQTLLDWHHASAGPIDGGWGSNSQNALMNFQRMQQLPVTRNIDIATWQALTQNFDTDIPILIKYTISKDDVNSLYDALPASIEDKSKLKKLPYENIAEMLSERFHMDVRYFNKLNKNSKLEAGDTITVINVGKPLKHHINKIRVNSENNTLNAYNNDVLIASYPVSIDAGKTSSVQGISTITKEFKMPWYVANIKIDDIEKSFMIPPGPNSPVGVVWMTLSDSNCSIHGLQVPELVGEAISHGCIGLTNWDAIEVFKNTQVGTLVELQ